MKCDRKLSWHCKVSLRLKSFCPIWSLSQKDARCVVQHDIMTHFTLVAFDVQMSTKIQKINDIMIVIKDR